MRNNQTLEQVSNAAESKVQLLKNSKGKYFLSAFMAGTGCLLDWGFC